MEKRVRSMEKRAVVGGNGMEYVGEVGIGGHVKDGGKVGRKRVEYKYGAEKWEESEWNRDMVAKVRRN
jgi:hypothetical protein